jgi:multidrug efflux pump subunit AcrB
MSVVEIALKRPFTVVASLILVCLMGIGAALRMPIDIFPEIDIRVVAVVWNHNGMSAQDVLPVTRQEERGLEQKILGLVTAHALERLRRRRP